MAGNFSFLKRQTAFSRMSLDQVQEQNNKYVKYVSVATSLVNRQDESALVRWELCRLLHEFEKEYNSSESKLAKHNEDNKTFQNDFYNDVLKVFKGFPKNPFQLQDLTVVNNTDILSLGVKISAI